jgi:hypothetical protein
MLSILICSLKSREKQLSELLAALHRQQTDQVEILVETNSGEMSIGAKRNKLVGRAGRKYVAFVDDDDMVAEDYCPLILSHILLHTRTVGIPPDCVGMVGILKRCGHPDWTFRHSITVGRWCRDKKAHIYFRTPNHLNPILREIVVKVPFPEIRYGEDRAFSDNIRPHLKCECFIEKPIYIYNKE